MIKKNGITISIFFLLIFFFFQCKNHQGDVGQLVSLLERMDKYNEARDSVLKSGWENPTTELLLEKLSEYRSRKEELNGIDPTNISKADQINYKLANYLVDNDIYILENKIYENPLNSEGGFLTDIFYALQDTKLETEEERSNYLKKLKTLPEYVKVHIDLMGNGMISGKMAPKVIVQNCINLLETQLTASIEQSIYLEPAITHNDPDYINECRTVIRSFVIPSLQGYHKFLVSTYLPKATEDIGVSIWPDGKAYYEQRIKYFTTLEITPDEVFDVGQTEVSRIRSEMEDIITELDFKGSFADFLKFLRTDPQFYSKTPEDLLEKASRIAKKMEEQMPKLFGNLPRMPFTVVPVPEALAPNYTSGRYSSGSYENHKAGQYWVNTYKLENRPLYVLPALTLHEAVPGHHHQIMLAQEIEGVPKMRRDTYLSAFGEGWGLYSEFLGIEAGIYETPYENFGRLTYEMWRACRLVVDVGMHYKDWTRDQAVLFMSSNTALSIHEVNTEIDRYIGWPGQAVSYKMGELKIKELRRKAEDALGDQFNIRDFHDHILKNGSILMSSLERVIEDYIKDEKMESIDS